MTTSKEIGGFIDGIAGKIRTPSAVAGRLIEEVVELGLSVGLSPGAIMEHVADSLANQAMKLSKNSGFTIFPSHLNKHAFTEDIAEMSEECADVSLALKDLCHVVC